MRELRTQEVALLIVSHNLDEVLEIADEVTVFRDGQRVASGAATEWSKQSLIKAMLGRTLAEHVPAPRETRVSSTAAPIMRVEDAHVPGALLPTALEVMAGEILGIAGLVGSGRTTLLRALAGAAGRAARGQMWVDGSPVRWPHTPLQARKHGIALLSEDRQGSGLLTRMSAADNVVVSDFAAVATGGFLSRRAMRERAREAVGDLGFDLGRLGAKAATFSGGNQQKLLIGRWRYHRPAVLLADEPTRGVDIGAKEEILRALRDLATAGSAVVLVSSELEEVVSVADRVLVLSEGHMVGELRCGDGSASVEAILKMAFRAQEEAA
jgi:ABC-type sugar transport system ATPase subunit